MGASMGGGDGPMADINVTPLIDVVLVLLVVFMVITPMLSSGLPVDLPAATSTVTVNDAGQHVVVSLTSNDEWAVDQEVMVGEEKDLDRLVELTKKGLYVPAVDKSVTKQVLLKADRGLSYGQVREVLDALAKQNIPQVLIAAGKEK